MTMNAPRVLDVLEQRSSNDRIGVAVVGAGIMGHAHAAAVASDGRAELVGVASVPREGAQELADRYGTRATADYGELLERPDIDLAIIATPDHLHADAASAAARAGKALLIEKPLATSLADADIIIEAVRETGVLAMVSFNHRWIPAYAQAQAQIVAGDIGLRRMAYARKNDRISVPTEMLTWAAQTSPSWFLSSHDIDLLYWFFSEPVTTVYATEVRGVLEGMGVETPDGIQAQLRFASGAVATVESCWIYPNSFPSVTDSFIEIIGTDGVIHLDRRDDQLEIASNSGFHWPRASVMPTIHGQLQGALRQTVSHALDCMLTGNRPLVSLGSSRHVTAILDAIQRSVESNAPVGVTG